MKSIISLLLTPIFYICFISLLFIFHPIQFFSLRIFGYKIHKSSVDVLNWFLMQSMKILGTEITFTNFKTLPDKTPKIFVCNHQSMWDISPLIWKLRSYHMKFISKKELSKNIPSVSFNLKYGGSVTIDRSKPLQAKAKIKKFADYINNNNYSVCIFPEGTRSRDGKLKKFKTGGIQAMLEIMPNAIIVPIAIKNTSIFDNGGRLLKNPFVSVQFTMLKPKVISINSLDNEIENIRNQIKNHIS